MHINHICKLNTVKSLEIFNIEYILFNLNIQTARKVSLYFETFIEKTNEYIWKVVQYQ